MKPHGTEWWVEDLATECVRFQLDLSCLVDGEMDEVAAAGAITHLEACSECKGFFDDARDQVRAHRQLADADGLLARYSALLGGGANDPESAGLVERLASVFYQLGKAYVLAGVDPGFKTRVFEKAAQVASLQNRGRGFVDGVLANGPSARGGVDWSEARHMLNGRLESIESPLEKGRRLLEEALAAEPAHEEARLYLAWLDAHEGKKLRAAKTFRQVFRNSICDENRAHAALQLGKLEAEEGEIKKAIACNRWIVAAGLADGEERFFFARFNIAIYYADLGRQERSMAAFRELLDLHPAHTGEIVELFQRSPRTRAVIDLQPGFAGNLKQRCPELFEPSIGEEQMS